jgi:hypothetical protein
MNIYVKLWDMTTQLPSRKGCWVENNKKKNGNK